MRERSFTRAHERREQGTLRCTGGSWGGEEMEEAEREGGLSWGRWKGGWAAADGQKERNVESERDSRIGLRVLAVCH
jgi:hypothetical protein